ncbi:hypothetical protein [Clostridium sp. D53t1_180928_C8]|uniref:hypothetical protein n=1 Tax=Clostridium sp. D53t1_180928_C8 TaxID=2787101 RepID=UPI0018AA0AFD|nr:hypothetical protein [Clostridium sp. D53t1_180928_C8]
MFKTILKTHEISFTQKVNMWIYYIKKIPLIGKTIPESIYNTTSSKIILNNILRVFMFIFGFAKKYIYMFLIVIIPSTIISDLTSINGGNIKLHIFFFLNFIMGSIMDNKFWSDISTDFYMINLMRINAKEYYLSNIFFSYIELFIYFLFPMMLLGFSVPEAFIITLEFVSFRIIAQGLHLLFSHYSGFQLTTKWYFTVPAILIPFLIAYGSPFIGFVFYSKKLLLNIPFIIIVLLFSIISFYYLISYKKYTLLAKRMLSRNEIDKINAISSEANFISVQLDDKKFKNTNLKIDKYKDKHGLSYLNSKFIERHKQILINPIKIRVIILLILFILAFIFTISFPKFHKDIVNLIMASSGILVFIIYITSIGEKITKAFFFNCDNSLLRYKFYKEPKILISNFKSRLKISVLLNLIPALVLAFGLLIILKLANGDIIRFIPIFISILTLSCFFSVHYLFLYYIAQPYTSQLTIKSPIYQIASFVVYISTYTCLHVKTASIWFTTAIILITILYVLIALILVYKLAPKNFKLK